MAYKSVYEGIIFIEGKEPDVQIKGNVTYKYGSFGSQLKSLNDVKKSLASQAKFKSCNCIVEFEYGQKSSWFSIDDMKWYGSGKCGIMPKEKYDEILNNIK